MLVKFKRKFFGPDGNLYSEGLQEISDAFADSLPRDAVIMSEDGTLPSSSPPALPGYGAKPLQEQVLDQVPYAAPTHQIRTMQSEDPIHPKASELAKLDANAVPSRNEAVETARQRKLDRQAEAAGQLVGAIEKAKEAALDQAHASGDPSRIREAEAINPGSGVSMPQPSERPEADTTSAPVGSELDAARQPMRPEI